MPTLHIFKGLPASGKSTRAKELLKDKAYRRVNKDMIRVMLNNYDYENSDEKLVHRLYIHAIESSLKAGYNTIADATQLAVRNETELRELAHKYGVEVVVEFFDTPVEECIRRDALREGSDHVGEKVIRNFYDRFLRDRKRFSVENPLPPDHGKIPEVGQYTHSADLPWAVMFDLDGTLADMAGKRGPFEWKKCIDDEPREAVVALARMIRDYEGQCDIIFMSGRDEVCREETLTWIKRELSIEADKLYMRPEGDNRKDNIVKAELFDKYVRGNYNIHFVVDDRKQVVDMWRSMGLDCFQVQPGDF